MLLGDATDIAALIADGADVNERNSDGDTPLIVACEHGLTEVVTVLLAANASVDLAVIAPNGWPPHQGSYTPMVTACEYGHLDIVTPASRKGVRRHIVVIEY